MNKPYYEMEKLRDMNVAKELDPIYAKANCKGESGDIFFPPISKGMPSAKFGSPLHKAFMICNECEVKIECFNFAVAHESVGVWGGRYFTLKGVAKTKLKRGTTC